MHRRLPLNMPRAAQNNRLCLLRIIDHVNNSFLYANEIS